MKISPIDSNSNFKGLKLNSQGIEKFCRDDFTKRFQDELVETAKIAKKSINHTLILNDVGEILFENKELGIFELINSPEPKQYRQNFSCWIKKQGGALDRLELKMPSENSAKEMFLVFTSKYMPEIKLKLFKAMEIATQLKNTEEVRIAEEQKTNENIKILNELATN